MFERLVRDKRITSIIGSMIALAVVTFQGQACNYVNNKGAPVEAASLGFGNGSASEKKALDILSTNCASCHGGATGAGNVANILSPQANLNSGMIVPGQPSLSPLYTAMESGRMPPSGPVSADDLAAVRAWITGTGTGSGSGNAAADPAPVKNDPLQMADRNSLDLYFGDGRSVLLSWDLSSADVSPVAARFPAIFTMDVKVVYQTIGGALRPTGYQFSNPRIQMLTGEIEVEINGLNVRVNGAMPDGTEPFLSASAIAKGIDAKNIYDGNITVSLPVISDADRISVGFQEFVVRPRTDRPPIPPTPTLASQAQFTAATRFNITVGNDSTARRWCLTANPKPPTSTAAPCPGFEGATTTGWLSARPTQFDLVQVGRPILANETITFYVWVANSDLKISAQPGTAQVTFDNVAPTPPAFDSVQLDGMQVANLINLRDNAEAVSWCVKESSLQDNLDNANGCSFNASKPSFVGLRGGGTRYVAVFIRDRAGNLGVSAIKSVNNTFGQITFAQLTNAGLGARGVFANRCAGCHGSGMPNQSKWDMTSYANTVAKKSQILNRIENTTQPMPPTGLLPDLRERALIKLWFTQTGTPVQL